VRPRIRQIVILAAAIAAFGPAQALAVDPETAVGGSGSKWFSGSLLQQSGNNCSILGGAYSETMVSAIAGYGGAPGGQVVKIGDRYYASLLISIPGNPCGSGSTVVGTDLVLPRGTSVDTGAQIRCFGQPRNAATFIELTGGGWSFMNSSGPYCPAQVGGSLTGTPGAVGVGFRPLASGQLYQLFVPITSSQTLQGAAASPADEVRWVLSSSGTYAKQGATYVWANVFPAGTSSAPFIYFARNPSVVPFWNAAAPEGQRNQAEWFANLYSAGKPGTLCYEFHQPVGPTIDCTEVPGWNGTVTSASDSWQVFGNGPNGGYVPLFYDDATNYTIHWTFTPNDGSPTASADISFTSLPGPDGDGDGVADSADACPAVAGTEASGCQPAVQSDPDTDGIFGAADKCPDQNGGGAPDGCLPAGAPAPPGPAAPGPAPPGGVIPAFGGATATAKLKRSALAKGVNVPVTCSLDSDVSATLSLARAVAKRLGLPLKRKQAKLSIATAAATCTAAAGGKLKLRLKRSFAAKVRKPRRPVAATLVLVFSRPGAQAVTVKRPLKLG